MKKSKSNRRRTAPVPETLNMDAIALMTDDELHDLHRKLVDGLNDAAKVSRAAARPWEIELAYCVREMQVRKTRRDHHNNYLEEQLRLDEEAAKMEEALPEPDFDNSAFTVLFDDYR